VWSALNFERHLEDAPHDFPKFPCDPSNDGLK